MIPPLKSWFRKVVKGKDDDKGVMKGKPILVEQTAVTAKETAAAAADVSRASQEILASKTEERRYFEELPDQLNYQVQDMKSISSDLQNLEGKASISIRTHVIEQDDRRISVSHSGQSYANGEVDVGACSVRSLSPPSSVEPSVAPHPKSYMDIMAMILRGEKPSNIRDINDQPPNLNQPIPDPRVAPKPKPWEVDLIQNSSRDLLQSQGSGDGLNHGYQDNPMNGDSSTPRWQRKNDKITEIETVNEQKFGSTAATTEVSLAQYSWVPPQPPPVAMAEAAAAI